MSMSVTAHKATTNLLKFSNMNTPTYGFQRHRSNDTDKVIYNGKGVPKSDRPDIAVQETTGDLSDGIYQTEDFAVDLHDGLKIACGVAAIGGLFCCQADDLTVVFYGVSLVGIYALRQKWRHDEAVKREWEYYGALKFPVFFVQVDRRIEAGVREIVTPLELRFKGIKIFYTPSVLKAAEHYRAMILASGNEVLVEDDAKGNKVVTHVHELYFQDVFVGAGTEDYGEYPIRVAEKIIKTFGEYKAKLAALKDTAFVKTHFFNQN